MFQGGRGPATDPDKLVTDPRPRVLLLSDEPVTSLVSDTKTFPRCLTPIGDQIPLANWIECLIDSGIRQARIHSNFPTERLREFVQSNNAKGRLRLDEAHQPREPGSAATITANLDLADDTDLVILIHADTLSDVDLRPLLSFHRRNGVPITMMVSRTSAPQTEGVLELDEHRRVVSTIEHSDRPITGLVNAGVYVMDATVYREIAAMRATDLEHEVLPRYLGRMQGWIWGGHHERISHQTYEKINLRELGKAVHESSHGVREGLKPAVFLDRDGTLIAHEHYLSDPARVRLLPGAAEALRRLRQAGFARVLVTNQSAIGRGLFSVERLEEIHAELTCQLAASGASLDGIYYCPDAPPIDGQTIEGSPDRKPGPGMLLRAAADLSLDLEVSWMVGDLVSDVMAGFNAGCRSILVQTGPTAATESTKVDDLCPIVSDFAESVDLILSRR